MSEATLEGCLAGFDARDVADADQAFLARLYASTRLDLAGSGANPGLAASLIGMQQRLQASGYRHAFPAARYLLLHAGGQPAGRLVVDAGADALRVVDISVLPAARGRGLGSAVLRALQLFAADRGIALTLAVHCSNPGAARLYRKLGFAVTSSDGIAEQMRWAAPAG